MMMITMMVMTTTMTTTMMMTTTTILMSPNNLSNLKQEATQLIQTRIVEVLRAAITSRRVTNNRPAGKEPDDPSTQKLRSN